MEQIGRRTMAPVAYSFSETRTSIWLSIVLAALAVGIHGALANAGVRTVSYIDEPALRSIDALLNEDIAAGRLPFAEIVISNRAGPVYHKKFFSAEAAADFSPETDGLYRIASLSKTLTSVGALILVDRGLMGLDDRVQDYLPELREMTVMGSCREPSAAVDNCTHKARRPIRVKDLMAHTSGFTYPYNVESGVSQLYRAAGLTNGASETPYALMELPALLQGLPLASEPGAAWEYGLSTDLLGRVIEVVSGQDLRSYLREEVFLPLGMSETDFIVSGQDKLRLVPIFERRQGEGAVGFQPVADGIVDAGGIEFTASYPGDPNLKYYSGGGGVVSSPRDFARFAALLAGKGEAGGARLISKHLFDQLATDQTKEFGTGIPGVGFGLGVGVTIDDGTGGPSARVGELFWSGIFYTTFWIDPGTGVSGVFMSQVRPDQRSKTARRVKAIVYCQLINFCEQV